MPGIEAKKIQFLARLYTIAYCTLLNIVPGKYFVVFCLLGCQWSNEINSSQVHLSMYGTCHLYKCCLFLQKEGATPLIANNVPNEISHPNEMILDKSIMHLLFLAVRGYCSVML